METQEKSRQKKGSAIAIALIAIILLATFIFITVKIVGYGNKTGAKNVIAKPSAGNNKLLRHVKNINDDETMPLNGAHEFAVRDNYLFVTSTIDSGITIFDITDPSDPKYVSAIKKSDKSIMNKLHSVVLSGNYAITNSMGEKGTGVGSGIDIFDISDLKNPFWVVSIPDDENIGLKGSHGMSVKDNHLYVAGTIDNALAIIDISDPKNPKPAKTIYDDIELSLKAPHSIAFKENYAYVVTATEGIEIFDISDPKNPIHKHSHPSSKEALINGAHDIEIAGNYAYVVSYVDGFTIFDVSNPLKPFMVSNISPDETNGLKSASDCKVIGDKALIVAEKDNSLVMVDISDKKNPKIMDALKDGTGNRFSLYNAHYVDTFDGYAYVAGMQNGFGIINFSH